MKTIILKISLILVISTVFFSCSNDSTSPIPDNNKKGTVVLKFDNVFGNQDFQLLSKINISNETTITAEELKYYISNISFTKKDGTTFVIPQDSSYFLIDESKITSQKVTLPNIPEGDYASVTFIVGVDSLRSVSGVEKRTGVLDVSSDAKSMYWTWNSGYIFFMFEGTFSTTGSINNLFKYHIGGFGGFNSTTLNNIKTVTLPLGSNGVQVRESKKPEVHIIADIEKVFKGLTTVSIETNPVVMFSPYSVNIANNYSAMFEFDHIHD
jgi:hypothetical protein